jgi:hypothetical protein
MPKLAEFSQGFLVAAIVLYVCVFAYAIHHDSSRELEIKQINNVLDTYHKDTNKQFEDVEIIVKGVMDKKDKEKSMFRKLINSGKTGFFVGLLSGTITVGPSGALATGVVFGLINPIVMVLNEILHVSEDLNIAKISRERDEIRDQLGHFSHLPKYRCGSR